MKTLRQVFEEHKDRPFVFVRPGGNQGDSMIYAGAHKLADEVGLDYQSVYYGPQAKPIGYDYKTIIYLHGGGGFCTWWNWTPRLLKRLRDRNPSNLIIVGPTTVALQDWYLKKYMPPPENTIFFAREKTTEKYVRQHFFPESTFLDHDTAFHLKKGDKYLTPLLGDMEPERLFTLLALREDPESTDRIPKGVNPSKFKYVVDPCQTDKWSWYHMKASEIVTNRSHSAILGMMLRKPTSMFAGGYHKNKSIFEHSLKDRGVKWIG